MSRAPSRKPLRQYSPALTLADVPKTTWPGPLLEGEELNRFYEESINESRGMDFARLLADDLNAQHGSTWFKRFLFGTRGSGKSTELTKLCVEVGEKFHPVRINIPESLNPTSFEPYDLVLAIAIQVARELKDVVERTESVVDFDGEPLIRIEKWFYQGEYILENVQRSSIESTASVGAKLERFIELGGKVTGSLQANSQVKEELKVKRRASYGELKESANDLLLGALELLQACTGSNKDLLILIEDLDKNTPYDIIKKIINSDSYVLADLETHLIASLPIGALSGTPTEASPIACTFIYDVPVFEDKNTGFAPHMRGRAALRDALLKRVSAELFQSDDDGVDPIEELVVASGGGLRRLLIFTQKAANHARADSSNKIARSHVTAAINESRELFRNALGEEAIDLDGKPVSITFAEKKDRLEKIYTQAPGHEYADHVLTSLLGSAAVQKLNGKGRYSVHPIVVDMLFSQELSDGPVPGGLL